MKIEESADKGNEKFIQFPKEIDPTGQEEFNGQGQQAVVGDPPTA
jgi:hypothetical protein